MKVLLIEDLRENFATPEKIKSYLIEQDNVRRDDLWLISTIVGTNKSDIYLYCWEIGKVNVNVAPLASELFFAHILPP